MQQASQMPASATRDDGRYARKGRDAYAAYDAPSSFGQRPPRRINARSAAALGVAFWRDESGELSAFHALVACGLVTFVTSIAFHVMCAWLDAAAWRDRSPYRRSPRTAGERRDLLRAQLAWRAQRRR